MNLQDEVKNPRKDKYVGKYERLFRKLLKTIYCLENNNKCILKTVTYIKVKQMITARSLERHQIKLNG